MRRTFCLSHVLVYSKTKMEVTTELIKKFFLKQCNEDEARAVVTFLRENPDVLDEHLGKDEWDLEVVGNKSEEFWSQIWNNIQGKKRIWPPFGKYAVAASIIGALLLAILYFHPKSIVTKDIAKIEKSRKIKLLNNGTSIMTYALSDGTKVNLSPGSSLEYLESFEPQRRNLILQGTAVFKVAKDKSRPFTVYSGEITTTALGTEFKVSYLTADVKINVELIEGKIVVNLNPKLHSKNRKPYYLLPGDKLAYDRLKMLASLTTAPTEKTMTKDKNKMERNNVMVFKKELLSSVFDKLAITYHVKITYSTDELKNLYLIGNYSRSETLESILTEITSLNGLKISKDSDGGFKISK